MHFVLKIRIKKISVILINFSVYLVYLNAIASVRIIIEKKL